MSAQPRAEAARIDGKAFAARLRERVGERALEFADAIDLSAALATNPQAQRCYLNQWFRYAYGRQETITDVCTLDEIDVALQNNGYNIKELLVSLTQTQSFRYRTAQEGE